MNISEFAVRRPVTVTMFVIGVLVFGFIAVSRLSVDLLPDLQLPQVTIATVYPGADPQTIEEEVTRPIEEVVSMTGGLQRVTSVSMENVSLITVEFDWGVNVNATIEELRAQLAALSFILPADAQEPLVLQLDLAQLPVVVVGVSVDGELVDSTDRAVNDVRPLLEQVPGVAQVSVLGGVQREIQVLFDNAKLQEHGLTPAILEQFLALQNAVVPGGVLENNGVRFNTKTGNHFTDVQQIRDLVIGESRLPVQGLAALWPPLLHVKDVAEVVDGFAEVTGYARVDGRPTVMLQVLKRPGANTVTVAQGVHQVLDRLRAAHPEIGLTVIIDQSVQVVHSLRNLVIFGLIGAALAVVVLFLFLRSIRSIAVIASAIPLSIVVTLVLLYFADLNLNLMTLGGLALGTGMLVDNAIIVLENIFRHRSEGKSSTQAAVEGAKEVGSAVFAATLTTVAVFLPVIFMDSFVGQLFKEMGLTVSLSLAASLVVALTIVPVMAAGLLKTRAERHESASEAIVPATALGTAEAAAAHERGNRLMALYDRLLRKALHRKGIVLGGAVVLLVTAVILWPRLGYEFLPTMPSRTVYVDIEMPAGTPLAETDAVAREVERRLTAMPEFEYVATQVGQQYHGDLLSLMQGQQTNTVQIMAHVPEAVQARDLESLIDTVRERLADLPARRLSVGHQWNASANLLSSDIVLQVRGLDIDTLESVAQGLEDRLQQALGDRATVRLDLPDEQPEIYFAVDQSRALIGGLSTAQVSLAVRNTLTGVQATQVRQDGRTIPVILKPHPDQLQSLDDLLNYHVTSPVPLSLTDTTAIRLANVADAIEQTSPQSVRRIDGARTLELTVRPAGANVRDVTRIIDEVIAETELPSGTTIRQAGLSELLDEAWGELGTVLLLAVLLMYMVMAAQFESWRYPLIVMVTVPLAAIGALWAMFLTGVNVGVASLVGVLLMVGIVVNNGIVLVDYTNRLVRQGMVVTEAVVTAARTRLRPVLMTAVTTIGGLLPTALSQEQGIELQGPIAITVIGGLTVSTLLTLFVVPSLYLLLSGRSGRDSKGGRPSGAVVALLAVALVTGVVATAPAQAQDNVSGLNLIAGVGYPEPQGGPLYLLGAGWEARWGDTDWQMHFATAGQTATTPIIDIGIDGSWFQPISFAGYYELKGSLSTRRTGEGPFLSALLLQADAVLGNITGHLEFDSIAADFPTLPWDGPRRLSIAPDGQARRHFFAELRQQPHRELNLLREFQWARSYDVQNEGHALLLASGAEVRAAGGWLSGKVGLLHRDDRLMPTFAGGFRLRPGPYSHIAIEAVSATALSAGPTLTADYELIGERSAFNATLRLALDDNERIQPSLFLQSQPHASGFRWQLGVGPQAAEQSAMFGLFTSF